MVVFEDSVHVEPQQGVDEVAALSLLGGGRVTAKPRPLPTLTLMNHPRGAQGKISTSGGRDPPGDGALKRWVLRFRAPLDIFDQRTYRPRKEGLIRGPTASEWQAQAWRPGLPPPMWLDFFLLQPMTSLIALGSDGP